MASWGRATVLITGNTREGVPQLLRLFPCAGRRGRAGVVKHHMYSCSRRLSHHAHKTTYTSCAHAYCVYKHTVRVPRQIPVATPPGSLSPRLLDFGGSGGAFARLYHHLRHLAAHLAEEAGGRLRDGLHLHRPIALPPRRRRRRALNTARSAHTIRSLSSAVVRLVRVGDLLVLFQFLQLLLPPDDQWSSLGFAPPAHAKLGG